MLKISTFIEIFVFLISKIMGDRQLHPRSEATKPSFSKEGLGGLSISLLFISGILLNSLVFSLLQPLKVALKRLLRLQDLLEKAGRFVFKSVAKGQPKGYTDLLHQY